MTISPQVTAISDYQVPLNTLWAKATNTLAGAGKINAEMACAVTGVRHSTSNAIMKDAVNADARGDMRLG